MAETRVTVFGGTGFLGRHIVETLAAGGTAVRVAVRHPERVAVGATTGEIETVRADVRDAASVTSAVEGTAAVVNAVGLYVERGAETFEAVHVRGAETVARQAASAGVGCLVHISGIGADEGSESPYVRARARGEAVVQAAFPAATILRPSVLFGPGDAFFNALAAITAVVPVFPLFGRGDARLQPVYVGDVAEAVKAVVAEPAAQGKLYELGGPRAYSYRALIELVLKQLGRKRVLLPVPLPLWQALAALTRPLPRPPVTRDQIALVRQDNVVGPDVGTFADLGITPTAVEDVLPRYLG